jgi:hypothetical protein
LIHKPSFDRSCQSDSQCATVRRTINCCGSELATAVKQASVKAFEAAAASCDAQFPACGCAAAAPRADDGTRFDDAHPYAVSKCTAGVCCARFVAAAKTSCGPSAVTCDARTGVCVSRQPVGPAIVYECKPVPAQCMWTRGCACLRSSLCTGGFNSCSDVGENSIDCLCPLCQ